MFIWERIDQFDHSQYDDFILNTKTYYDQSENKMCHTIEQQLEDLVKPYCKQKFAHEENAGKLCVGRS